VGVKLSVDRRRINDGLFAPEIASMIVKSVSAEMIT
jgi:hypothetical protein